jgi:NAD+ kinase
MSKFNSVGVVGRLGNDRVIESVEVLLATISKRQLDILLHEDIADQLSSHNFQVATTDDIGQRCDLVIVVGGDGSLLSAARDLAHHDVVVLGVNRGKLGFLTDIKPEQVDAKVNEVLDGKYSVEERFLLDISVSRDGEIIGKSHALNDVVINSGRSARMIDFDLYMNDDFVYSQSSDGLIVSTPTGSTAYALSGGGPIMHPDLDAIVLVPMFPHTLSARPIVVGGKTEIKIVIGDCHPYISCDGQVHLNAAPKDIVLITKKPHTLKLVHPLDHSFYGACRTKLGWSGRLAEPKV